MHFRHVPLFGLNWQYAIHICVKCRGALANGSNHALQCIHLHSFRSYSLFSPQFLYFVFFIPFSLDCCICLTHAQPHVLPFNTSHVPYTNQFTYFTVNTHFYFITPPNDILNFFRHHQPAARANEPSLLLHTSPDE
jgi:hypothetical protein